jgi:Holliday junction resolvase RusA-like endonuclease
MIRLTFPWSVLVPDNRKYTVARNRMILTREYREAKYAMHMRSKMQYRGPLLRGRLAIDAVLFEPNESRDRDPANYGKLIQDALKRAVYEDDVQIDDSRFRRGGIDPDNPRAEITVRVADEVAA